MIGTDSTTASPRNDLFWIALAPIAALALGALLPLTLTEGDSSAQPGTYWLFFAIAAYAGGQLSLSLITAKPKPMLIGFHLFCYLFLGLAPIVQMTRREWPLPGSPRSENLTTAAAICAVGILTYLIGYSLTYHRKSRPADLVIDDRRASQLTLASVGFSILFIAASGTALFSTRQNFSDRIAAVFGSLTSTGSIAISLGTVPITVVLLVAIERRRRGYLAVGALAIVILLNLAVTNVFSSPRFWLGTVVLAVFLALGSSPGSKKKMRAITIGSLVGFTLVFPIADTFRNETSRAEPFELGSMQDQLLAMDYDASQQISTAVAYSRDNGPQLGEQLAGSILFFLPRDLWEDKPEGTGALLGEFAGGDLTNLSAPLWAEGFIDFGVTGAGAMLLLFGAGSGFLDRRFELQSVRGSGAWLVAVPLLAFYQLIILRGSLIVTMPRLIVIIACVAFVSTTLSKPAAAIKSRVK
jgi:oligosaccharide repeat unit polymerase